MPSEKSPSPVDPNSEITFDQLMKLIHKAVRRACRRGGRRFTREDGKDFTQSITLSLLKNDARGLNSFEHRASVETWLQRVADNYVLSVLHGQKDMAILEDVEPDRLAYQPLQDEQVLLEEMRRLLDGILGELTEYDRELLEMIRQGLRTKEIAERLVIKPDSVRKSTHRLFDKIRERLERKQARSRQPPKDEN